jgi:serine/threonine protein kinase
MGPAKKERHRLALPLGYQLGSYQFQEQLGFGSFGITYLAYDQMLSRKVAIKELLPTMIATRCDTVRVEPHTSEDEEQWVWAQERFVAEAQTVAKCKHPNVLHVFEAFRANGTAYMVTQFEDGCTLTRWLKNLGRSPTESELRGILDPLLSALDTVHAQQFLHRDIKPDNIYMTAGNRPVLIDFGSARQDVTQRSVPMTAIVTEGYAPFEQYSENGRQGPWTDLYALAAVMYCAIVGHKPPSAAERAAAGEEDPCICLAAAYASQYSAGLLQSIDAGLRLNARSRPQSTAEWRHILSGSIPIRPEGTRIPTGFPRTQATPQNQQAPLESTTGRHVASHQSRAFQWFVMAALLCLGAVVFFMLVDNGRRHEPADVENSAAQKKKDEEAKRAAAVAAEEMRRKLLVAEEENQRLKKQLQATPSPTAASLPVAKAPPIAAHAPEPTPIDPDVLDGITVADLNADSRKKYHLAEATTGVVITEIEAACPGAKAGLKKGDVVHEINREPLSTAKQAVELSEKVKKEQKVLLRVSTAGSSRYLVLERER